MEWSEQFSIQAAIKLRPCGREDLPRLEWFGMFAMHRQIICQTFAAQQRREAMMIIADLNGWPVGQIWIDLASKSPEAAGVLWAFRVFPILQRLRIGTRLILSAERFLAQRGYSFAEIAAEKSDSIARRLYERLGYQLTGAERVEYSYTQPDGTIVHVPLDEWLLRKELHPVRRRRLRPRASSIPNLQEVS